MDGCGHDHAHLGLKPAAVRTALQAAEAACVADGERMTAPRRRVLELLLAAGEPVKAYDLIAAYGRDGEAAKPPTVYRALEFLERRGLAHRIASLSAYVACSHDQPDHAAAFLICDCCGATAEVPAGAGAQLAGAAGDLGFVIQRATVEAHGLCAQCRPVA
ncbi:MAG: transcriptional repressor [Alphaproteobacteria bacterium]|nr:transcriptional repressor [Alphaproteobacteria bacterium]MBU1525104.1 transcriptional repressor [Alphaproteobacteria bacterium]MBU2118247.1 transcriptional repressor [Alphaproteobacteria bacterium]MBU2351310.1 transcriptional repressor [Alphaproteobacteria bacterium]MBU2381495.1 transcriptional repressor [Alphaproteobacteria bacterium]